MANREETCSCAPSVESMQEFEVVGLMKISVELMMTNQSMWRQNE